MKLFVSFKQESSKSSSVRIFQLRVHKEFQKNLNQPSTFKLPHKQHNFLPQQQEKNILLIRLTIQWEKFPIQIKFILKITKNSEKFFLSKKKLLCEKILITFLYKLSSLTHSQLKSNKKYSIFTPLFPQQVLCRFAQLKYEIFYKIYFKNILLKGI